MLVINKLKDLLRSSAAYNKSVQAAPVAILWTDIDKQWQSAMPYIKQQMHELIELGDYQPEQRIGPAIWVKCAIAGVLDECALPEGKTPIIYLPGVGRKDLRAIEQCPEFLKPLAELQYRGCWWAYNSAGRDWSVGSFLTNPTVGLELDLAKDKKTQAAFLKILPDLLETPVASLQGRKLEAEDFYSIVLDDIARDILGWLNNPAEKEKLWLGSRWDIFANSCQTQFDFIPDIAGHNQGLHLLCQAEGSWRNIWQRFEETANNLPLLVNKLRTIQPIDLVMVFPEHYLSKNREDESLIELAFREIKEQGRTELKITFSKLWQIQEKRKTWVWYRLELSPWLGVLEEIMTVFEHTEINFSGSSPESMAEHFKERFWQADSAVLTAMAKAKDIHQQELIANVLGIIYTPWLENTALNFQQLVAQYGYPGDYQLKENAAQYTVGSQVVFFVDGLRFDTAKMLEVKLTDCSVESRLTSRWAALPSLTATAKAAITPIADMLTGNVDNDDFIPVLADGRTSFSSHYLKKILEEKGWQYLEGLETGDPQGGYAWVQTGDLDHLGHDHQRQMPQYIDNVLGDIVARINGLFDAGWKRIRIVTDHGWLWVPNGLPKGELNKSLGKNRQRRCAILKDNVQHVGLVVPWYWNSNVSVAMAPGISGYISGDYYNHGGLSLQECLTPVLELRKKTNKTG